MDGTLVKAIRSERAQEELKKNPQILLDGKWLSFCFEVHNKVPLQKTYSGKPAGGNRKKICSTMGLSFAD